VSVGFTPIIPALSSAVINPARPPMATISPVKAFIMAGIFCYNDFFLQPFDYCHWLNDLYLLILDRLRLPRSLSLEFKGRTSKDIQG
jgi:hypothetical protein